MGISEGQVLAGKYRVERVLGRGGMGVVVAAHHLILDETVAVKFLLPETLSNVEAVARFEREARAAVKIKSEHVARVTDVGRLESGEPYMVMELLRGQDLGALLDKSGPLPIEDVVDYVLQAGEAIAEAHGLGIVHRDLKPPNLFLTRRPDGSPCVKVLDFGISKVTGPANGSDHRMTATDAVIGSPVYMSPEQLMSARDVDMRTDIWALGVICYELLTGKHPFVADSLAQLCMAISVASPIPIRTHRPDVPVELEAIVLRCLQKDRNRRIGTVAELAGNLVKFAPQRARLSADRIERLALAAGFSASSPALPRSFDATASSEQTSTLADYGTAPVPPVAASTSGTNASWGQTANRRSGSSRVLIALGVPLFVVGLSFGAYTVLGRGARVAASSSPNEVTVAPAHSVPSDTAASRPAVIPNPEPVHEPPSDVPATPPTPTVLNHAVSIPVAHTKPRIPTSPAAVATTPVPAAAPAATAASRANPSPPVTKNVFEDR